MCVASYVPKMPTKEGRVDEVRRFNCVEKVRHIARADKIGPVERANEGGSVKGVDEVGCAECFNDESLCVTVALMW